MTIKAIDVRDLVGRPGATRAEHVSGTLEGLATELARVQDDSPLDADLLLESLVEGILVSGRIAGMWTLRCARCLREFSEAFEVDVNELFVPRPFEDGDDYRLDPEGLIDPDQMVRDAVGVQLPFSPLCRPDCRGLCPVCGGDRNLGECPGHAEVDPRWAGLEELLAQLEDDR
jgi:uncharacterized protein